MTRRIGPALAAAALLGSTATAAVPPVPATPARIEALVYAAPFTLRHGYPTDWRLERPLVTRGYLVVLAVKPDLVYPRQAAEPVLYVGDQTAERVNVGYLSGHVVAIVPENVDLARAPIWFGTPMLPEQVDARTIKAEIARATKAGINAPGRIAVQRVLRAPLAFEDKVDLLREAGTLVQLYSSDEQDLAQALKREAR